MNKWEIFNLPSDMSGLSFLDVGCWEGDNCAEAIRRKAKRVVGIDLCTCDSLKKNMDEYKFAFLQADIFSEKFLEIGNFDILLCSGVLYHVENVFSLLFRMRKSVNKLFVLETAITTKYEKDPVLMLAEKSDASGDPSVWWRPNKKCLFSMLGLCGFGNFKIIFERSTKKEGISRLCLHADPVEIDITEKIAPRRECYTSIYGGERTS
jgi:tRNA (mo5U34)-methyltransferase